MIDVGYADDLVLLSNTPDQTKSQAAARGFDLYMNADKATFMF